MNLVSSIRKIPKDAAEDFIIKWHYSRRCPTGKNIFFGWYINTGESSIYSDMFGNVLYAVADYGIGVNPYQAQSLSKLTGFNVENDKLLELKRLCRIEPKLELFPLTKFISQCHKMLRKEGYCYIVSFSDPNYGHTGGIYKAANFLYLGKTNAELHTVDKDGVIRHRRYYFRYARRNNVDMNQAREDLGLSIIKTMPKDRWFIKIGE